MPGRGGACGGAVGGPWGRGTSGVRADGWRRTDSGPQSRKIIGGRIAVPGRGIHNFPTRRSEFPPNHPYG
ncbi:hypothetical protein GCM10010524_67820 [Streptomyces mexicanus]